DRAAAVERVQLGARDRLGLVAQLRVLEETVRNVEANPVHAAVEPEAVDRIELAANVRVVPVEVRLLRREQVKVVTAGRPVALPRGPAEDGQPVVRLV